MRRAHRVACPLLLLATACAPVGNGTRQEEGPADEGEVHAMPADTRSPEWTGYAAHGNEPFWRLEIGAERIAFEHFDRPGAQAPRTEPRRTAGGWRFASETTDGGELVIAIEDSICEDSMSGQPFPHNVAVTVAGETFRGCGGATADLLTGDAWRVTRLGGEPVPAGIEQTLAFNARGHLTGSGGCNRYGATYRIRGPELVLGPMRATSRACVGAGADELESRFFALLGSVTRFAIGADGALELYGAGDDPAIVARR